MLGVVGLGLVILGARAYLERQERHRREIERWRAEMEPLQIPLAAAWAEAREYGERPNCREIKGKVVIWDVNREEPTDEPVTWGVVRTGTRTYKSIMKIPRDRLASSLSEAAAVIYIDNDMKTERGYFEFVGIAQLPITYVMVFDPQTRSPICFNRFWGHLRKKVRPEDGPYEGVPDPKKIAKWLRGALGEP